MPAYDYRCSQCESETTIEASITEDIPTPVCFKCRGAMTRVFGVGSIQFKGTGWGKDAR